MLQGAKPFYEDSGAYWRLADSFTRHGSFSLLNFDSGARGYVLPLMYDGLEQIINGLHWSESSVVKLFNAVVFALIGTLLAPKLAEVIWPGQSWGLGRRMVLTALLVAFWSGFLNFPLSDFPGLALALLALVAVSRTDRAVCMLLAGLADGLATDVRAAYVLLGPSLVVIVFLTWFDQRATQHASSVRRGLCLCLLLVGFAAASLPQSLSAHRYHGTWSFVPGASLNLSQTYLAVGLPVQLRNTYIKPKPDIGILSADKGGERLEEELVSSSEDYVTLIENHPLAMGALFARHVINGLDQRYSTVYVENLHTWSLRWLRIIGFVLIFLTLWTVLWPSARRRLGVTRWRYPIVLVLCTVTSVPEQMETRYLLPVYLVCWITVLRVDWLKPLRFGGRWMQRLRTTVVLAVAIVVFATAIVGVTSATTNNIQITR